VIAAELLLALAVTNALRRRLPYRVWRTAHMLNLLVWVLALGHGLTAGSDSRSVWASALYALSAASVVGLFTWRVFAPGIGRAEKGTARAENVLANSSSQLRGL
jgi:sulfoxide reductase heme-binding subunit YedZ